MIKLLISGQPLPGGGRGGGSMPGGSGSHPGAPYGGMPGAPYGGMPGATPGCQPSPRIRKPIYIYIYIYTTTGFGHRNKKNIKKLMGNEFNY